MEGQGGRSPQRWRRTLLKRALSVMAITPASSERISPATCRNEMLVYPRDVKSLPCNIVGLRRHTRRLPELYHVLRLRFRPSQRAFSTGKHMTLPPSRGLGSRGTAPPPPPPLRGATPAAERPSSRCLDREGYDTGVRRKAQQRDLGGGQVGLQTRPLCPLTPTSSPPLRSLFYMNSQNMTPN